MSTRNSEAFDFDAWYSEHVAATIPFRLLGQDWQIKGDVDAAFLLKMQRMERWTKERAIAAAFGDDPPMLPDGITAEDLDALSFEGICRKLAGDDVVDQWFQLGIPAEMLRAVSKRLYAIHSGQDPDEAIGLGKAPAKTVKAPQDRKKARKTASPAG